MKHFKNFYINSEFFKPKRLVWQETEPKPSEVPEAEEVSREELREIEDFLDKVRNTMKEGDAIYDNIRVWEEERKTDKLKKAKPFIDDLSKAILEDKKFRKADTFKRAALLQRIPNLDLSGLMASFEYADSYEIKSDKPGRKPVIIFTYPDGAKEERIIGKSHLHKFTDQIKEGSAISKTIHFLKTSDKTEKIGTILDFIDEVSKAILTRGEYRYANSIRRAELLQKVTDLEAIITRYGKAKDYTIEPYRRGKNPAMIIFEYPDGTTEEYPLELFTKQKKVLWGTIKGGFKESLEKDKKARAQEVRREEEKPAGEYFDIEGLVARSHHLNTPDKAYYELKNITKSLPDDLLESLSMPLSQIADVVSNAKVQYDAEGRYDIDVDEAERPRVERAEEKIEDILDEYFGGDFLDSGSKATDQQFKDILAIVRTFGLD